jgi:hypothetical protein
MRWVFFCFGLSVSGVLAEPLGLQVRFASDTFLVYEAIPATVSIHNYSARDIQLDESDQGSGLSFFVTTDNQRMVRVLGRPTLGSTVVIPAGRSVAQTIDLLPLYELRERGTYTIQAVLRTPVGTVESPPVRVTIINGRELWKQVVGLPVREADVQQYRTYALLGRRGPREDSLYVSVRDDAHSMVYSLVPLGAFLSTSDLQVRVDRGGNVHVLFQNGPRSFGYVEVDPIARVLARFAYSDFTSRPALTDKEGEISVTGGEQTYPKPERMMSEDELRPPPPPAKKKSTRHWWWPFGPK